MRISDWSSDVCSSDLADGVAERDVAGLAGGGGQGDTDEIGSDGVERRGLGIHRDDATTLRRRHPALQGFQILHQLVGRLLRRLRGCLLGVRRRRIPKLVGEAAQRRAELVRSEAPTSELQSLMRISYAVFCLKTKTHKSIQ